jgi:hypothetical protein
MLPTAIYTAWPTPTGRADGATTGIARQTIPRVPLQSHGLVWDRGWHLELQNPFFPHTSKWLFLHRVRKQQKQFL